MDFNIEIQASNGKTMIRLIGAEIAASRIDNYKELLLNQPGDSQGIQIFGV